MKYSTAISKYERAFTLIEMLVVIVIIGILAGALVPKIMNTQYRANDVAREVKMKDVSSAIVLFAEDNWGKFPISPFLQEAISYNQQIIEPNKHTISLFPKAQAVNIPGIPSTTTMIADQLNWYITTIPLDGWKGIAAYSSWSCGKFGDAFWYYTNEQRNMFAITATMESKKGNTNNCGWVINKDGDGVYKVVGVGLTESIGEYNPAVDWNPTNWCMENLTDQEVVELNILKNLSYTKKQWCDTKYLILRWLWLTMVPSSIWKLPNVVDLYLESNQLTSITFPSQLPNLRMINLAGNQLKEVRFPEMPNIILLYAQQNQLESAILPNNMPNLSRINLQQNKLKTFDFPSNTPLLEYVRLNHNPNLQSLVLPPSLNLKALWLYVSPNLKSVTLPNNIWNMLLDQFHLELPLQYLWPDSACQDIKNLWLTTKVGNRWKYNVCPWF